MERRRVKYVRVVREAGGLGDLVRLIPVLQGIKEKYPDAQLHYFGLDHYRSVVMRSGVVDLFIPVQHDQRRSRLSPLDEKLVPYLKTGCEYDVSIDLFCPAYIHEVVTEGAVTKERTHLWAEAAGVPFKPVVWRVTEEELKFADSYLAYHQLDGRRLVAVQPFGTTISRNWHRERWIELIKLLRGKGYQVIALDCCARVKIFDCHKEWHLSFSQLAAVLKRCALAVCGDSGVFHLASAVGTKTLGLFGVTSGPVMCDGYPRGTAHYLNHQHTSLMPDALRCRPPCYMRRTRGWCVECHERGCFVLNAIPHGVVFDRALQLLQEKHEKRMPAPALC